jgi:hypothetical protein
MADFPTPRNVLGAVRADEIGERMNGRQPLIASGDRAMSCLFKVLEEETNTVCGEMLGG